jgi:hypothetical protein
MWIVQLPGIALLTKLVFPGVFQWLKYLPSDSLLAIPDQLVPRCCHCGISAEPLPRIERTTSATRLGTNIHMGTAQLAGQDESRNRGEAVF